MHKSLLQQYMYKSLRFIHDSSKIQVRKKSRRIVTFTKVTVLAGVSYAGYRYYAKNFKPSSLASPWQVTMYRALPLRAASRFVGYLTELEFRPTVTYYMLRTFVWLFGCEVQEALVDDLHDYQTVGQFFRRELKQDARSIDKNSLITSPADGKVLHFGRVQDGSIEQVKGIDFNMTKFLGPNLQSAESAEEESAPIYVRKQTTVTKTQTQEQSSIADQFTDVALCPTNALYFCTIYLAPGDYHRFHSPTNWTIHYRRHFPGDLLGVSPSVMRWVQGLFNYNERVIYFGSWIHGFFSFAAIGATTVGSIVMYNDPDLLTNQPDHSEQQIFYDKSMQKSDSDTALAKGQPMGEFNFGSSIVFIFEAPDDFKFNIKCNQKIKVGESIGT